MKLHWIPTSDLGGAGGMVFTISSQTKPVPATPAQQAMMATVPDGVSPGNQFQLLTPTGPMMVTCPPNAVAGQQIQVMVPVQIEMRR